MIPAPNPSLSLESLRCFAAAARAPSFRHAARTVALTPAAFGQRIKQLESQLEARLFERTTRRVSLTAAGHSLLPAAERCLASAEECVRAARGEHGHPATEIVLGTRHEIGLSWVVPELAALRKAHPWLKTHLYFGAGPDLLLRVRTSEIDCAITSTRFSDPRLDAIVLQEERYVFCAAPKLIARAAFQSATDASKHVLLDASADLPLVRYLQEAIGGSALHFADVVRLGSIGAIRYEALRGAGVAVLPEYWVREAISKKRLVRLLPKVNPRSDYMRLVFRANEGRRSTLEAVADFFRAAPMR